MNPSSPSHPGTQSAIDRVLQEVQQQRSKELERRPWPGGQSYSMQSDTELPFQPGFVSQLLGRFSQATTSATACSEPSAMSSSAGTCSKAPPVLVVKAKEKEVAAPSETPTLPASNEEADVKTTSDDNQTESFVPIPSDVSLPIKNIVQNVRSIFEANPLGNRQPIDAEARQQNSNNKNNLRVIQRNQPVDIRTPKTDSPNALPRAKVLFDKTKSNATNSLLQTSSFSQTSPNRIKDIARQSESNGQANSKESNHAMKQTSSGTRFSVEKSGNDAELTTLPFAANSSQSFARKPFNQSIPDDSKAIQNNPKDPIQKNESSSRHLADSTVQSLSQPVENTNSKAIFKTDSKLSSQKAATTASSNRPQQSSHTIQTVSQRSNDQLTRTVSVGQYSNAYRAGDITRHSSVTLLRTKDQDNTRTTERSGSSIRFVSSDQPRVYADDKNSIANARPSTKTRPDRHVKNSLTRSELSTDQSGSGTTRPLSTRQSSSSATASIKPTSQLSRSRINQDSGGSQFRTWTSIALQRKPQAALTAAAVPVSKNTDRRPNSLMAVQQGPQIGLKRQKVPATSVQKITSKKPSNIEVVQRKENLVNKQQSKTDAPASKTVTERSNSTELVQSNSVASKVEQPAKGASSSSSPRRVALSSTELENIRKAGKSWYFFAEPENEQAATRDIPDGVTPVPVGRRVNQSLKSNQQRLFSLGNHSSIDEAESAGEQGWLAQSTVWDHIRSAEAHGGLDNGADPQLAEEAQRLLAEAKSESSANAESLKKSGAEVKRKKLAFASDASLEQTFVFESNQSIIENRQQLQQKRHHHEQRSSNSSRKDVPDSSPINSSLAGVGENSVTMQKNYKVEDFIWGAGNVSSSASVQVEPQNPLPTDPSETWSAANLSDLLF